ncbi:PKD domain-containing protein [Pedobacter nutrimenti]|uniref:PKD domain-containing protein n=1 Tax=Pedobacter nutrimenti TaxID=1241337 RepID=UPI002930E88B|nr:PKD domain-containing protein [Pedobacter nutrimenti]
MKHLTSTHSILLGYLVLALFLGSCRKAADAIITEPDNPKPKILSFSINPPTPTDPFTFSFKAAASNYQDVLWSFGDGGTSYELSPAHTFLTTGTFKVNLTAHNKLGYWAEQEGQITIRPQDIINFTSELQADGSFKLQAAMPVEIQSFSWYNGSTATDPPISTTASATIPMLGATSNFANVTLKIKTPKGAEATYTKIVTNAGVLNDVTANGVIVTVSDENPSGPYSSEGSLKLVDGDINTKFLLGPGWTNKFWAQQKTKNPAVVNAYTLVSGNDSKDRDPKDWNLQGSLDGTTWVTLDTRSNITSDLRKETKVYLFDNSVAYSYYRMNITAIRNGSWVQMSEWRLMSTAKP